MSIEARKIALVQEILGINNEKFIKELELKIIQLLPQPQSSTSSIDTNNETKLNPPITEIRKNVNLDEIIAEQKTSAIGYEEIQELAKEGEWDYSLKELLAALN